MKLTEIINQRLQDAFSPSALEVIDDSHKHRGHPGAQGGAGHFTLKIHADCFLNQSRITTHRQIYEVLADFIPEKIHALQIHVLSH